MSEYNELVVEIQELLPEGKGFGLTEMVKKYLYDELGYIPAEVSASLSIKYKPKEITGEKKWMKKSYARG